MLNLQLTITTNTAMLNNWNTSFNLTLEYKNNSKIL